MKKFALILFFVTGRLFAASSLTFDGSNDSVDFGSGTSIDLGSTSAGNTFTVLAWAYRLTASNPDVIWSKTATGFSVEKALLGANGSNNPRVAIGRATVFCNATASTGEFTANVWRFIGATWDGTTVPHLYIGSLTKMIDEVSSYSVQDAGSGTIHDDSGNGMTVGAYYPGLTASSAFNGPIGIVMQFNRVLSVAEMQDLQFNPRPIPGCVFFSALARGGLGTQLDFSGNGNSGTISGAAESSNGPPIFVQGGSP
jgi:hypothetical protein